ncbi:MAG: hypothetical protein J0L94_14325 [Rhodothermia bacterium]|nr:hypothetical protein [Rhodothermia bacterium]
MRKNQAVYLLIGLNMLIFNPVFSQINTNNSILLKKLLININRDEGKDWPFTARTYLGATTVVLSERQIIEAIKKDSLNIYLYQEIIDGSMYIEGAFMDLANKGFEKNLTMTSGFMMFYLDMTNVIKIGKSYYVFVKVKYAFDEINIRDVYPNGSFNQNRVKVFRILYSFSPVQSPLIRNRIKFKYQLESFK